MKKKTELLLLVPVALVVLFNGVFILFKLEYSARFIKKIAGILGDYVLGIHFYLFLAAAAAVFIYALTTKRGLKMGLMHTFFILLLFIGAVNWAWFAEFNKTPYPKIDRYLIRKNSSSMGEAIMLSHAVNSQIVRHYIKLNEILKDKILILPNASLIKDNYFFLAYVNPKNIITQDYNPALSYEEYYKFYLYWKEMLGSISKVKGTWRIIVVDINNDAREWMMLTHDERVLIVPAPLSRALIGER